MAQVIDNAFFREQKALAQSQPRPLQRRCLSWRDSARTVCALGQFVSVLSLIVLIYMKLTQICPGSTPYFLCVSNRHCAYLNKVERQSYLDLMPFIQSGGRCVSRGEYTDFLYKGAEKGIDFVNWLAGENSQQTATEDPSLMGKAKELFTSTMRETQKKRLVSEFKYYYDEVIFFNMTRYELGLWIVFATFFFLKRALNTCGDRKTVFDFMRPAKGAQKPQKEAAPEVSQEEQRRIRAANLKKRA